MIKLVISKDDLDNITSKKNFTNDNVIGKVGEKMATQYLTEHRGLIFCGESEDRKDLKGWDLEFKKEEKKFRYEVKTDVYIIPGKWFQPNGWKNKIWVEGKDTGNIFIEFHSRGVESGISTTTADVWMNFFFHLDELWIIPVDKLRKIISENNFPVSEESGDINSHTKGYLIPREQFKEHFKVVKYQKVINETF